MKAISVTIEGSDRGLLMNNPIAMTQNILMDEKSVKIKSGKDIGTPREEADKVAYWTTNPKTKKKELYIPSEAIFRSMINASSMQKIGKASAKTVLAGSIFVNPDKVLLGTNEYDIDVRTVVIPANRARVVKARPNVKNWEATFEIVYNDDVIGNPQIIYEILKQAGQRVGILDFRPQKSGQFGTFTIKKWVLKR